MASKLKTSRGEKPAIRISAAGSARVGPFAAEASPCTSSGVTSSPMPLPRTVLLREVVVEKDASSSCRFSVGSFSKVYVSVRGWEGNIQACLQANWGYFRHTSHV